MSDWLTLPDDLLERADEFPDETDGVGPLMRAAAQRICELEVQLLAERRRVNELEGAIVSQRGHRDYVGGKIQSDLDLWAHVAHRPWGKSIAGDG